MEDINPTTRCFPRTLCEAFPQDFYAYIEEPEDVISVWDVCVIAASVCMWVMAVYWWSVQ